MLIRLSQIIYGMITIGLTSKSSVTSTPFVNAGKIIVFDF